jgi:hypothetical protein
MDIKDRIKEDGCEGTYITHGGCEKCVFYFLLENPKERELLADINIDGKIILKWILKAYGGYGLDLSQDLYIEVKWILSTYVG